MQLNFYLHFTLWGLSVLNEVMFCNTYMLFSFQIYQQQIGFEGCLVHLNTNLSVR